MPRSVPDDDMMDSQQSRDLGHATKSSLEHAKDVAMGRVTLEARAILGSGTLIPRERERARDEAMRRAAYPSKRK